MQHNCQRVIHFWFQEIDSSYWFKKSPEFDQKIQVRFGELYHQATQNELFSWRKSAEGSLAEIIILDQFSRNIFRDSPLAFKFDSLALALAQNAIANGRDRTLSQTQRAFLYMPFMHSESKLIHDEAVKIFTELGNPNNLEFEKKHKIIIDKFGRYPHRNKVLGRVSTPDEIEFLKGPGSSF